MSQQELFGVRAMCTGMLINYHLNVLEGGVSGMLIVTPQWSKQPKQRGLVAITISEQDVDVVPELMREAFDGLLSNDPGYYIPRWVKQHFQEYQQNHE